MTGQSTTFDNNSGCSNVSLCPLHESPILDRWPLADSGKPQEEPSAGKPPARICEGKSQMAKLLDIAHYKDYFALYDSSMSVNYCERAELK